MKKMLALLLAAVMVLSMAACAAAPATTPADTPAPAEDTQTTETTETTETNETTEQAQNALCSLRRVVGLHRHTELHNAPAEDDNADRLDAGKDKMGTACN